MSLSAPFNDAARNTGRLKQLAALFKSDNPASRQTGRTAQDYMQTFEDALNSVGNSVFALTDGECDRLIKTLSGTYSNNPRIPFPGIINALRKAKKAEL